WSSRTRCGRISTPTTCAPQWTSTRSAAAASAHGISRESLLLAGPRRAGPPADRPRDRLGGRLVAVRPRARGRAPRAPRALRDGAGAAPRGAPRLRRSRADAARGAARRAAVAPRRGPLDAADRARRVLRLERPPE